MELVATIIAAQIALAAAPAAATVRFIEPERFTDATFTRGPGPERERAEVMRAIDAHLQQLAAERLPAGQTLEVEIRDIDLAGHIEPFWRTAGEIRVLRGVTWPAIVLRYRLSEAGVTLREGSKRVADLNYQWRLPRYPHGDRLRYEKAMLDDWFERRLVARQPA